MWLKKLICNKKNNLELVDGKSWQINEESFTEKIEITNKEKVTKRLI